MKMGSPRAKRYSVPRRVSAI